MEKVTGTGFLAGAAAEVVTIFYIGMIVCVVLYGFAFLSETLLQRYRVGRD